MVFDILIQLGKIENENALRLHLPRESYLRWVQCLRCPLAGRYQLLLSGPVESVDHKTNTINVVGHRIAVRDSSAYLPGYKINVFGGINTRGATSAAIVQRTNAYAASSDQVMVTGKVTTIDRTRGRVLVDGANVDYTTLLARSDFAIPAVGDAVRIVGIQPMGRGTILASEIAALGVTGSSQAARRNRKQSSASA